MKKKLIAGFLVLALFIGVFYNPTLASSVMSTEVGSPLIETEEKKDESSEPMTEESESAAGEQSESGTESGSETVEATETAGETESYSETETDINLPAETVDTTETDSDLNVEDSIDAQLEGKSTETVYYMYWDAEKKQAVVVFEGFSAAGNYVYQVKDSNLELTSGMMKADLSSEEMQELRIDLPANYTVNDQTVLNIVVAEEKTRQYINGTVKPAIACSEDITAAAESDASLKVSWKHVSSECSGYKAYVYKNGTRQLVGEYDVNTSSVSLNDLSAGEGYTIEVISYFYDKAADVTYMGGGISDKIMLLKQPTVSMDYRNLALRLKWNRIAGASGYKVFRYNTSTAKWDLAADVNTIEYTDSKLTTGKTYKYKVQAYNGISESTVSKELSSKAYGGLSDISGLKVTAGECKVTLTWKAAKGAKGYGIYMREGKNGKLTTVTSHTNKTSYDITDLKPGTDYYFQVRSFLDTNGVRVYGNLKEVTAKPTIKSVGKLTSFTAAAGEHQVTLKWTKPQNATGTRVYMRTSESEKWKELKATTGTEYVVTNLEANKTYMFALLPYRKVYNQAVLGQLSASKSAVPKQIIPDRPTGLKAKAGDMSVTLSWGEGKNATGYILYYYDKATGKKTRYGSLRGRNSYTIKGLKNGQNYTFVVSSYRQCGNFVTESSISGTASAKPVMSPPTAPKSLTVTYKSGSNNLSWPKVENATGYIVYLYNYSKEKYEELARVTTNSYVHKDQGKTGKFKYLIKTYRTENGKTYISTDSVSKLVFGDEDIKNVQKNIHTMYYSATVSRNTRLYKEYSGDAKIRSVNAGEKVTVTYRRWGRSTVKTSKGEVGFIPTTALTFTAQHYTKDDYTKDQKEIYVNSNGFSSKTKYLIWVSVYTQRANFFEGSAGNWKLTRSVKCATGKISAPTPLGYNMGIHGHDRTYEYGNKHYDYLSYYKGGNAFHTRIKYLKGGFYDTRIGKPVSNGCIRLYDEDAIYLYKQIPLGTKVVIY